MKELEFLGSLIIAPRSTRASTPRKHSFNELYSLLKKFYAKFNPSKCGCCDVLAEYYLDKLPQLSSRLHSTYESDLCCVLDYDSKSKFKNGMLRFLLAVDRSALVP